nr:polyserase-2-like [Aedes albopictus]
MLYSCSVHLRRSCRSVVVKLGLMVVLCFVKSRRISYQSSSIIGKMMTPKVIPLSLVLLAVFIGYSIQLDLPKDCGQRKADTVNLIVDGKPTTIQNWPWHTAIHHREGTGAPVYKCGGSILNEDTILTAGHCVRLSSGVIPPENLIVQVGRQRLHVADDRAQEHAVDHIMVHKKFRLGALQHDIALIKLATHIKFTSFIQPVCLWNRGEDRLLIRNKDGTVVGFGATRTAGYSETLNKAELKVVDNQVCIDSNRGVFGLALTGDMFCAGSNDGVNACNGDSGGGMFFELDGRWYVRGIVAFSPSLASDQSRCDPYQYVVYMDVARYISWIAEQLNGSFVEAPELTHPKQHLLSRDCGENLYPTTKESEKSVLMSYPWVGLIEYSQEGVREKRVLCHAMLISERYLVTAAECVYNTGKLRPTSIRLGEYDTSSSQDCGIVDGSSACAPPTQSIGIETITVHQQYNKPRFANNIALIRLYSTADVDRENIAPVCLPLTKALRSFKPASYIRSGWKNHRDQPRMQRAEVKVVDSVECQRKYSRERIPLEKTFRQICIEQDGGGGSASSGGSCVFDTASAPLQAIQKVDGSDRYVLHGLLAFGPNKCHLDYPNVYTNVGTYVTWILDHMQK